MIQAVQSMQESDLVAARERHDRARTVAAGVVDYRLDVRLSVVRTRWSR